MSVAARDIIPRMDTVVSTTEITFTRTDAGVLRIGKTRVSLDSVIMAFQQGATPEQIVIDFDTLSLSEVYAAISYYLQNQEEVDAYLAERAAAERTIFDSLDQQFQLRGIRDRLLSRQKESC